MLTNHLQFSVIIHWWFLCSVHHFSVLCHNFFFFLYHWLFMSMFLPLGAELLQDLNWRPRVMAEVKNGTWWFLRKRTCGRCWSNCWEVVAPPRDMILSSRKAQHPTNMCSDVLLLSNMALWQDLRNNTLMKWYAVFNLSSFSCIAMAGSSRLVFERCPLQILAGNQLPCLKYFVVIHSPYKNCWCSTFVIWLLKDKSFPTHLQQSFCTLQSENQHHGMNWL